MDIQTGFLIVTSIISSIISAASIILKVVAPLTKTDKDDKVLKVIMKILEVISLHTETKK